MDYNSRLKLNRKFVGRNYSSIKETSGSASLYDL